MKRKKLLAALVICLAVSAQVSAQTSAQSREFNKPRGYLGTVEMSFGGSTNGWKGAPVGLSVINGYRFMPQLAIGVGIGVQMIGEDSAAPLFLHLRSDILNNWISPYIAVNAGYNLTPANEFYGGFMAEPTLGVGFNAGRKGRVTIGAFYSMNTLNLPDKLIPVDAVDINYPPYRAANCVMGLKVGMSF